uniref:Uncharacterized protein n=1 Tax=Caulobacter phage BL57 TaxID=3348355 RepID=A0AB74ULD2_9VIRU
MDDNEEAPPVNTYTILLALYDEQRLYIVGAENTVNAVAYAKRVAEAHDDAGSNWQVQVVFAGDPEIVTKAAGLKVIDLRSKHLAPAKFPTAERVGGC